MAAAVAAAFVFASCEKDNGTNDNGGVIDDGGDGSWTIPASLKDGSNFYLIQIGDEEREYLEENNKVALNLMPYNVEGGENDGKPGIAVDVWSAGETYTAGDGTGLNSYGFTSGWLSLVVVAPAGWSGGAYALRQEGIDDRAGFPEVAKIEEDIDNYYLHFAYKSEQKTTHVVAFKWGTKEYPVRIGHPEGTFDDGKGYAITLPVSGEFKLGEWNEYEIPLKDTGIDFSETPVAGNLFSFLSGAVAGTTLDLDAIFLYRK